VTGASTALRAGGVPAFERLVEAFYVRVEQDPVLRPMYPEDLEPGKRHLALFLAQYFGAGPVYADERGHPRLRMRHAPFPIDPAAAGRWSLHMREAVLEQGFEPDVTAELLAYVDRATPTLVNRLPTPGPGEGSVLPADPTDGASEPDGPRR